MIRARRKMRKGEAVTSESKAGEKVWTWKIGGS